MAEVQEAVLLQHKLNHNYYKEPAGGVVIEGVSRLVLWGHRYAGPSSKNQLPKFASFSLTSMCRAVML